MSSESPQEQLDELWLALRKKLAKLNLLEIKQWFELIDKPDVSDATVVEVIQRISSHTVYMTFPVATYRHYRCRPLHNDENPPTQITELLTPPIDKTRQERCNLAGNPVLYVSDNPSILPQECHIKAGQQFAVAQFNRLQDVKEDLNCFLLGVEPRILLGDTPEILNIQKQKTERLGSEYGTLREIESSLHKSFIRDDDPSGLTYTLTARLCDYLFSMDNGLDAICYPSIAAKASGHNHAIRAGAIDKAYEPVKACLYELNEDGSWKQIDGAILNKDGKIEWGKDEPIDSRVPVRIRQIDPNDPDRYIAPWK